jgi:solute carrier family 35 protein F1/2
MSNDHDLDKKDLKDDGSLEVGQEESEAARAPSKSTRPPIVYSSPGAFAKSFAARWKSLWTRQFILALLAGQVVSLCITCTNVTTTELVNRGWTLSTTQGFFLWVIFH